MLPSTIKNARGETLGYYDSSGFVKDIEGRNIPYEVTITHHIRDIHSGSYVGTLRSGSVLAPYSPSPKVFNYCGSK